jgi:cytochrome c biogenesis protein CcmG/thiol:disulfide interchange protein DsbE
MTEGSPKKFPKGLIISFVTLAIFAFLMIFGLKHNPNFNPSQLIGKKAPSFQAPLATGKLFSYDSAESSSHWTLINFWSSSCYVCREEAKDLEDFYKTVTLTKVTNPLLLSVNIQDDSPTIFQWQKDFAQTFPVIRDTKGFISVDYGVTGTPETFFIDPNNVVRFRVAGMVNKNLILKFIQWLTEHPKANESDAVRFLASGT